MNSGTSQADPWATAPNFHLAGPSVSNSLPPFVPQSSSAGPSRHSSGNATPTVQYAEMPALPPKPSTDPIIAFLAEMPSAADNPTRVAIWTELVRFKTRSLELLIAEAKRKEREAELELARFKDMTAGGPNRTPAMSTASMPTVPGSGSSLGSYAQPPAAQATSSLPTHIYPYYHTAQAQSLPLQQAPIQQQPLQQQQQQQLQQTMAPSQADLTPNPFLPQSMTPFDLHAITENFDDMFNWLPDLDQNGNFVDRTGPLGIDPTNLHLPPHPSSSAQASSPIVRKGSDLLASTPIKRSASSGAESIEDEQPATKKSKRTTGKKVIVEVTPSCTTCKKPMGKIMVRAPQAEMPDPITAVFRCLDCAPVKRPPPVGGDAGLGGPAIGTVETRKRQRMAMEAEDEEAKARERRQFCDVCQRVIGSGQVKGGKENIGYMAEVVCASCDAKYQRCTDCGGGGGPRQGIGKWRLKQVFQPGRKTCSLSHSRIGDRQREIGVHVTPSDFTPAQFTEVISRCKALWQEKNLSRLAVPEMMEIDLPANLVNPLQSYADIENQITGNWPSRESMIRAEGADPQRFKRILGLTWAHARPRRGVRTVDLEEEQQRVEAEDEEDNSTVLDNIKKTNVVIPAGCELIGMWGGEWDIEQGSILVSTFIPFEGTDGEDSTALSVGEIITKVQTLQHEMNQARKNQYPGITDNQLTPQVEHLWVVSGGSVPLVRERMADILIRKRSFVHVEEYLTRHPSFAKALQARPYGLHPTDGVLPAADGSRPPTKPLILVRWLGKDFNAQKIQEIKQMEFGGKTKPKRKAKAKV